MNAQYRNADSFVTRQLSRRGFIKTATGLSFSIGIAGLVGACEDSAERQTAAANFDPNIWVTIGSDEIIEITCSATEMGQGSMTSLPVILCEELDADWSRVKVIPVTRHDPAFGNPDFGGQLYTAGQASVESFFNILRHAGAQARRMLLDTAAQHWSVPVAELVIEPSLVLHKESGRSMSYGELAAMAIVPDQLPEIGEADFKHRDDYRIIGKTTARLDIPGKVDGSAIFGIDISLPDMHYGMVIRAPVEGSGPVDVDYSLADLTGVTSVVSLDYGVGIVGTSIEAVIDARKKIDVTWSDPGDAGSVSSANTLQDYQQIANDRSIEGSIWHERGDLESAFAQSAKQIEAEYQTDYAYHAQLEPINATALVSEAGDAAEIWVSTQTQTLTVYAAANALGTSNDKITVHPILIGGGFGRRTHMQYVEDAVLLSRETGKPVKVIWSREDDVKNGLFRPLSAHSFRVGLDETGRISAWHHRIATPSVLEYFKPKRWENADGIDVISMKASDNRNYDIPNMRAEHLITERQARIVPYRGIGAGYTRFAIESFIDEVALAREMDPLALRLELSHNSSRMQTALKELAELCDWHESRDGTALGLCVTGYGETVAAGAAEVSLNNANGEIRVHNFWTVVDPGLVIDPGNTTAQMEGAVVFGVSHALKERITITDGIVDQSNYHDYPVLRMSETPDVHVKVLSTDNPPSGIGETGVPLTAAAIANAVARLEGIRLRHLPLTPERVLQALQSKQSSST
jgi:isoquinoline 1-oxidoreductase beta subunit